MEKLVWRDAFLLGDSGTCATGFSLCRFVILTEAGGDLHPQLSQKLGVFKMQLFLPGFVAVLESNYTWIYFSLSLGLSSSSFLPSWMNLSSVLIAALFFYHLLSIGVKILYV